MLNFVIIFESEETASEMHQAILDSLGGCSGIHDDGLGIGITPPEPALNGSYSIVVSIDDCTGAVVQWIPYRWPEEKQFTNEERDELFSHYLPRHPELFG